MFNKCLPLFTLLIVLSFYSCAEKTTEERLEDKAEKAEKGIKKFGDKLKKEIED